MTNYWCVLCRGTRLRDRGPVTSSKPWPSCFRKTTLLPLAPREDDQNGPRVLLAAASSRAYWRVFAVTQQLSRHVSSRVTPRHLAKFDHAGTSILVATNWFCDSSKNPNLFLFDLGFSCWILPRVQGLLEYIADWEYLPIPLTRTGFRLQWGSLFLTFFTFLALSPASAFLASGFFSLVSGFSAFSPAILQDGKKPYMNL